MKVYWCRADELRDEYESGADTTVVEYVEANAEVCQLRADCDQHEDRIAQLNEILHGERSEIARLREALRDYLLSDEAAEGNGYGCYSAGMREKLWALVGREGR